ncbi:MAG: helix-turn-helix domain-containing protein [Candidatus Omnitrophica bacterium]|nr:helix-turn-helix domain-containing protein [Candidatus Omnitrophota bacterium]MCM8799788.1 helix-turn-helix domain-containing protein [Candidatus Omnitrophota bacterium]
MAKVKKLNQKEKTISAKDIVNRYNISYQSVNHYTDLGLLPVSFKIRNIRFYDRAVVEKRLKKIRELMKEGYSLRLIRKRLIGI